MKNWMTAAALAFALVACAEQAEVVGETASVSGCQAVATEVWRPLSGAEFTIEATSAGPDCARAVATLTIRDVRGHALYTQAYAAEQVMGLNEARDLASMQQAMSDWIRSSNSTLATTALPDWPVGAQGPVSGEFPFYVEEGVTRADYLALKRRNAPVYCYIQGLESQACLALEQGGLIKIGVQTFPG